MNGLILGGLILGGLILGGLILNGLVSMLFRLGSDRGELGENLLD
ncbi:hypothetical protein [Leptolyngbya ohadii]|nr:hypothetical protein [Leptolyngbya ohadii]